MSLQSVMHPVVLRVVLLLLRALERAPSSMSMLVLMLVVREVVGQGVGVAEAAVAGDDGGATAVELLHQIHLFKVRPSVEIVMYTYYTPALPVYGVPLAE